MTTSLRSNRGIIPVSTLEEVERYAPSVFATHAAPHVSSRYHFANSREIVDAILSNGWKVSGVQENRVKYGSKNYGFQRHVLRFRAVSSDRTTPIVVGDIAPELVLMNSHDAGTSFMFSAGLFRFVCTNGLVVAESTFANLRVTHSSKELDHIVESARRVLEGIPTVLGRVDSMKNRLMTPEERRQFAIDALLARYGENVPVSNPEEVLVPVRAEDRGSDLWSTMNVAQENLTHGFSYTGQNFNRRKSRGVTGVRPAFDLNRALWNIADGYLKN